MSDSGGRRALLDVLAFWLGRPGSGDRARVALALPGFVLAARAHGLAPVVAEAAGKLGAGAELLSELRAAARDDAARGLLLESAAAELAAAAGERGLRAALLKGPALAHGAYPRPELRPFSDLDLLVPPEEMPRWEELLRSAGWSPPGRVDRVWLGPHGASADLHARSSDLVGVIDVPDGLSPVQLDVAGMLARTRPVEGLALPILSAEDELLLAAGHGLGVHVFERLVWLLDVAVLISRPLDAGRLAELTRAAPGASRLLWHALEVCRRLNLADAPAGLAEALQPERVGRLERRLVERLARGEALPDQTEFLLALALPAPPGFKRELLRRALLPHRRVLESRSGGRLRGALRHAGRLLKLGALAIKG